jgi:hypothetical protein
MEQGLAKARRATSVLARYPPALLRSVADRGAFDDVETFCLFVGYPRSGHSVLGSILDAHPDAVIAHELDVLKLVRFGYRRGPLFSLLLRNARRFGRAGRAWSGYDYQVPGEWQGRHRRIHVIGDKMGASTNRQLQRRPELAQRLRALVRVPVRMIHVTRNPYDNIATMARYSGDSLPVTVDEYFSLCHGVAQLRAREPSSVLDVRHEALIADPRSTLRGVCDFLGLDPSPAYVEACASIVFDAPRRTRFDVEWSDALIGEVSDRLGEHSFLAGYSFAD